MPPPGHPTRAGEDGGGRSRPLLVTGRPVLTTRAAAPDQGAAVHPPPAHADREVPDEVNVEDVRGRELRVELAPSGVKARNSRIRHPGEHTVVLLLQGGEPQEFSAQGLLRRRASSVSCCGLSHNGCGGDALSSSPGRPLFTSRQGLL